MCVLDDFPFADLGSNQMIPAINVEGVTTTTEAEELASAYVVAGVITEKYETDALHVALATIARVDVLVSWNRKHIVNLARIRGFNSVNLREGYQPLEIRNPSAASRKSFIGFNMLNTKWGVCCTKVAPLHIANDCRKMSRSAY